MKCIGLIGGTSWPSTIEYYRVLNELVSKRLGGFHSANLLLKSIDFHTIKSNYQNGWDKIPDLLQYEIENFLLCKPDCLILCNNTLHKAYDLIAEKAGLRIPFFHAIDLTAEFALVNGYKNLLLLATKFTMEDGFYAKKLEARGLNVEIPAASDREHIQLIQNELAKGHMLPEYQSYFKSLIARHEKVDAVVLACTELPLAIRQEMINLDIIDPIELQCRAAIDYALL